MSSFVLRSGRGGSHQFERQDTNGSTWTSVGLCHKCSRPFIGAFTQTPVCCRACSFVACQGCASNQADWESKFRCASAKTSALTYQDLEDITDPQDRSAGTFVCLSCTFVCEPGTFFCEPGTFVLRSGIFAWLPTGEPNKNFVPFHISICHSTFQLLYLTFHIS